MTAIKKYSRGEYNSTTIDTLTAPSIELCQNSHFKDYKIPQNLILTITKMTRHAATIQMFLDFKADSFSRINVTGHKGAVGKYDTVVPYNTTEWFLYEPHEPERLVELLEVLNDLEKKISDEIPDLKDLRAEIKSSQADAKGKNLKARIEFILNFLSTTFYVKQAIGEMIDLIGEFWMIPSMHDPKVNTLDEYEQLKIYSETRDKFVFEDLEDRMKDNKKKKRR
jgi:hypothetical protein